MKSMLDCVLKNISTEKVRNLKRKARKKKMKVLLPLGESDIIFSSYLKLNHEFARFSILYLYFMVLQTKAAYYTLSSIFSKTSNKKS